MEDKLLVAKTLLKCYPHLADLYQALTNCTEECIRNGFYAIFPKEQMKLYESINSYEQRKVGVYNMKYLIEQAFNKTKSGALSILKERFLFHRSMGELIDRYKVSLRTCYRYIKKGLAELAANMEELGYDKKRIICEYGDEPLFLTMLNRVIKEDDAETEQNSREQGDVNNRRLPPLYRFCCGAFSEGERAQQG